MDYEIDAICVGSVLWDVIGRTDKPISRGEDVGGYIKRIPGGVAFNIAQNLINLELNPCLLGFLGNDSEGDQLFSYCQNAGINADLTWNLNQRINDIIKHNPDYITILIGTNDAIGSHPVKLIQDYYIQTKNLPQAPSIEWFEEQIEIFVKKIKKNTTAKIAISTLPWLGEQEDASIMIVINNYNVIIKKIALKYDISILDLYSKFKEQISEIESVPYTTSELRRLRGLRAVVLYYVFGWSWNKIGKKYNLQLLCDHIHLNERGGSLMENMVKKFLSA